MPIVHPAFFVAINNSKYLLLVIMNALCKHHFPYARPCQWESATS